MKCKACGQPVTPGTDCSYCGTYNPDPADVDLHEIISDTSGKWNILKKAIALLLFLILLFIYFLIQH